ncbi:MAG: hypothetical protein NVSMB25_02800 [Thermoleophilaceae bacterium]
MSVGVTGILAFCLLGFCLAAGAVPARATPLGIEVKGNRLVDSSGQTLRLLGVNFSGAEYACIQGAGIWDSPTDDQAVRAIVAWRVNAVRIPLNEDCWLKTPGAPRRFSGAPYRRAITTFVERLHAAGLYVILDLHWNAPGRRRALGLQRMADLDHSPRFWHSVSHWFRHDRALVFDVYNEPHDITWRCWRDGCRLPWRSAGMQSLVRAVRAGGGGQPIMVGGLAYANDLSSLLEHLPHDPLRRLIASFHVYNFNECIDERCWDGVLGPIGRRLPIVTGELGEDDCAHGFIDRFMRYADAHGISYLGWSWNAVSCGADGPALITSPDGTPTPFGQGLHDHLAQLSAGGR